jgi:hypothetical protein
MSPHNTGSKRLKYRRQQQRRRKAEQLAELLPTLISAHTRAAEEIVARGADGQHFIDWGMLHVELDPGMTGKAALPAKRAVRRLTTILLKSWHLRAYGLPAHGTGAETSANRRALIVGE